MAGAVSGVEEWQWSATSSLKDLLGDLLTTGFQSDLTIVLGKNKDKEVGVHKIFLQCRSRVLHSKIMKCGGNNRLELEDVEDYASFKKMLKYLYTGESGATITEALPLLKMATDFEVGGLVEECGALLKGEITVDNVLQLFEDAMKYGDKILIDNTLKCMCRNGHQVLNLPGFSNLRLECLIEIIQQDDLMVKDEMEVFNAVYEWGQAECVRERLDPVNNEEIRILIAKPLKYVRFPLMDKDEFVLHVMTKDILSSDEIVKILAYFVLSPEKRANLPPGRFTSTPRNHSKGSYGVVGHELQGSMEWEISRRNSNLPICLKDAKTHLEILRFAINSRSGHPLKLKAVVFAQGILPPENAAEYTWDPGCGGPHNWRTPFHVEVSLFKEREEVKRMSKVLQPSLLNGDSFRCPFMTDLETHVRYKLTAKFIGKSYCYKYLNEDCSHSPLHIAIYNGLMARPPLRCVTNFEVPPTSPVTMGSNYSWMLINGQPFENPTQGFIERFVFEGVE